jgi:hypothetical protein
MEKEQEAARERPSIVRRSMGILKNGPDITAASHSGAPTMTPASETGDETLSFGTPPTLGMGGGAGVGNTATVETVTPGSTPPPSQPASDSSANPSAGSGTADPSSAQPAKDATTTQPADKSKESTSKKKKGIRKIIP